MTVGLFIPCYVDAFFPEVGIGTLELLERFEIDVVYPLDQTCCGQPMANSGCHEDAAATERSSSRTSRGSTMSSARRAAACTISATT